MRHKYIIQVMFVISLHDLLLKTSSSTPFFPCSEVPKNNCLVSAQMRKLEQCSWLQWFFKALADPSKYTFAQVANNEENWLMFQQHFPQASVSTSSFPGYWLLLWISHFKTLTIQLESSDHEKPFPIQKDTVASSKMRNTVVWKQFCHIT